MRIPRSLFNRVYSARPAYRQKLIAAGRFDDTHFEIDDAELAKINGQKPEAVRASSAQQQPTKPCSGESAKPLREPSIPEMLENFGAATLEWVRAGIPVTTKPVVAERAAVCEPCEFWDGKARRVPLTDFYLGKCKHPDCGCTRAKLFFATAKCPLKKWKR